MIPFSLYIKVYFWSYDQKYCKFSYYFLYIFQQLKSQISQIGQDGFNPFCDETLHINRTCSDGSRWGKTGAPPPPPLKFWSTLFLCVPFVSNASNKGSDSTREASKTLELVGPEPRPYNSRFTFENPGSARLSCFYPTIAVMYLSSKCILIDYDAAYNQSCLYNNAPECTKIMTYTVHD